MTLPQLLAVLRARWLLFTGVFAAALALGALLSW